MMDSFEKSIAPGIIVGLVGVGQFGNVLRDAALNAGCKILLRDPPRSFDEADELSETFFGLWGNGMGGCQVTGENLTTFVPLSSLACADVIAIQVPLTDKMPWPTRSMISKNFLDSCKKNAKIFCFSESTVIAADVRNASRIILHP
ncbi:MAG: hypothetical protein MJ106_02310 [Lentisphaeria bacterium]|nr:hypothetical protein [Lentisphaeria bacterium]